MKWKQYRTHYNIQHSDETTTTTRCPTTSSYPDKYGLYRLLVSSQQIPEPVDVTVLYIRPARTHGSPQRTPLHAPPVRGYRENNILSIYAFERTHSNPLLIQLIRFRDYSYKIEFAIPQGKILSLTHMKRDICKTVKSSTQNICTYRYTYVWS